MTIAEVDQLVIQDDATAARLWPRLGPKVRAAYLQDRDAWTVLRRRADDGRPPTAAALAAKHQAFTGWARAFRAVGRHRRPAARPAGFVAAPLPAKGAAAIAVAAPFPAAPASIVARSSTGGVGTAVAGGMVLAGLVALAARRTRS